MQIITFYRTKKNDVTNEKLTVKATQIPERRMPVNKATQGGGGGGDKGKARSFDSNKQV